MSWHPTLVWSPATATRNRAHDRSRPFKFVNDTLGHQAGDELIVALAELLSECLRTSDVLARLGGDEFAVLLPEAGPGAAKLVAQSVLETLRDTAVTIAGTHRRVTASIGTASFEPGGDLTGEDALINADLALYDAKEAGRDQAALFNPGRHEAGWNKGRIAWAEDQLRPGNRQRHASGPADHRPRHQHRLTIRTAAADER